MLGRSTIARRHTARRERLKRCSGSAEPDGGCPGMPVLALHLPEPGARATCRPARDRRELDGAADLRAEALKSPKRRVSREAASRCSPDASTEGRVDERWYWAAPFLLDCDDDPDATWLGSAVRTRRRPGRAGRARRGLALGTSEHARWLTPRRPRPAAGRPGRVVAQLALGGPRGRRPSALLGSRVASASRSESAARRRRTDRLGISQPVQPARGDALVVSDESEGVLEAGARLLRRRAASRRCSTSTPTSRRVARAARPRRG